MVANLKIAGIAFVVLALAGLAMIVISQSGRIDQLNLEKEVLSEKLAAASFEISANRDALKNREETAARLRAELEFRESELAAVYAKNPDAKAWADSPCPPDVLDCLVP